MSYFNMLNMYCATYQANSVFVLLGFPKRSEVIYSEIPLLRSPENKTTPLLRPTLTSPD